MSLPSELPSSIPFELQDEIISLNAIFGPDTLSIHSVPSTSAPNVILLLTPPSHHPLHPTTLLLSFPPDYPSTTLSIVGVWTIDPHLEKGFGHTLVEIARKVLARTWTEGQPGIFDFLSELENDERLTNSSAPIIDRESNSVTKENDIEIFNNLQEGSQTAFQDSKLARFAIDKWTLGEAFDSHKSVFVAHAIPVFSAVDVMAATESLLEDKHIARATHNVRAWRLRGSPKTANIAEHVILENTESDEAKVTTLSHEESDDDGESKAGARVLSVMQAMNAWNMLIVVSRWYGGVKLGPERFRIIGSCSRDVLVKVIDKSSKHGNKGNKR